MCLSNVPESDRVPMSGIFNNIRGLINVTSIQGKKHLDTPEIEI